MVIETKFLKIIRLLLSSIILLKILEMISFVFDLKYLRQNLVNFNFQGVFWNPQDVQISKLSLDLKFEQDLKEILKVFLVPSYPGAHCIFLAAGEVTFHGESIKRYPDWYSVG